MGLSLLKASKFPDHEADMGLHNFVYSFLPHDKPLEESQVFEEAFRLNNPLWVAILEPTSAEVQFTPELRDYLNSQKPLIDISDAPNIQVAALKRSEDHPNVYILRLYEDRGEQVCANVKFNLGENTKIVNIKVVNSLEEVEEQ